MLFHPRRPWSLVCAGLRAVWLLSGQPAALQPWPCPDGYLPARRHCDRTEGPEDTASSWGRPIKSLSKLFPPVSVTFAFGARRQPELSLASERDSAQPSSH